MARIPVEHDQKGSSWWMWLIGLLLIAGLVWLLAGLFDDEEPLQDPLVEGPVEEVEPIEPGTLAEGAVTDVTMIFTAADPLSLVGRDVQLEDMYVTAVPGDSVFLVRPQNMEGAEGEAQDVVVFARLDEVIPAPPPDVEGRYNVEEGQTVTIYGTIQQVEETSMDAWGLADEDQATLGNEQIFIHADRLEIAEEAGADAP